MSKYAFRDLGDAKQFLNIRIIRDPAACKLWLCQDAYIEKLLTKFHLESYHQGIDTPLSASFTALPHDAQATASQIMAYQQRVGSLIYPAVVTRPDIAYAAAKLSQFNTNPSPDHLREANRCIAYLYNTRHLAIEYSSMPGPTDQVALGEDFHAASDAAYADDAVDRKSTQGYLISLFGGPIAWQSGKQRTVTTSTTKAELLALSHVGKEIQGLQRLFEQMQLGVDKASQIRCDNKQTVGIATKEAHKLSTRMRHVDVYQF